MFLAGILLAPASLLYFFARREQRADAAPGQTVRVFTRPGWVVFIVLVVFAIVGIVLLATGVVQIAPPAPVDYYNH
jgi:arginine:ornithine antiporter/lysine permease